MSAGTSTWVSVAIASDKGYVKDTFAWAFSASPSAPSYEDSELDSPLDRPSHGATSPPRTRPARHASLTIVTAIVTMGDLTMQL